MSERQMPLPDSADQADWQRVLADAWRRFPGQPFPSLAPEFSVQEPDAAADLALLHWIGPLVAWARARLEGLLPLAAGLPSAHPLLLPEPLRLRPMVKRVLISELARARQDGLLRGTTPEDRFADFTESLRNPDRSLSLLRSYPVLAAELVAELHRWIEVRAEFTGRLVDDLPVLRDWFGLAAETLADVAEVEFGAGDTHRGGRSVAIVRFGDGSAVVYKPRSLDVEAHFAELLAWVNGKGLRHRLRAVDVLARPGYGWCAYVEAQPCARQAELGRFYWRQGAHLALLHVLRAYDMHAENVIASGEHPVFIDLEAMFHAEWVQVLAGDGDDELHPVERALQESVLAVGLLPQRVLELDDTGVRAMDLSGMTGGASTGEFMLRPELAFAETGTDRMRETQRWPELPETRNRPVWDGQYADIGHWADDLIAGFRECYRLLLAHRSELGRPDGPLSAFADDVIRVVVRDTAEYRSLLDASWHPDLLCDPADRQAFLDSFTAERDGEPQYAVLGASEFCQLARNDVPVFTTTPTAQDLRDGKGGLGQFRQRTGMASVRARLENLSQEDLEHQLWFVRAALGTRDTGGHTQRGSAAAPGQGTASSARELPDETEVEELAVAAAMRIGDTLSARMLRDDSGFVEWMSLNLVDERFWTVGPAGWGLHSGITGIALFLAELAAVSGEARYRAMAQDVVHALYDPDDMPEPEDLEGIPVGGFEELGGSIHLLTRLGSLWDDPALWDVAWRLVPAVHRNLRLTKAWDVTGGAAGAALALASLQRVYPAPETMSAIGLSGAMLLDEPTESDGRGFARGSAGRAYALAVLAGLTGSAVYAAHAGKLLEAEFSATAVHPGNAWCGGAASTLLALAGVQSQGGSRGIGADLMPASAVSATREALQAGACNDSLCHGDSGLVDALLVAGQASTDPELVTFARRSGAAVARRILEGTVRCGGPAGIWIPGLMNGVAGIGHGLLRVAAPHHVPSVLLLRAH
ncbi:type 2 lanthipeptide synthetase LanM family protein [Streptomyces tirandamycinicus]|uniref:type 2 lanthipeptide synthetase LanM family protein n=1 Tax=Streptomyces tirandamycinicus TaxID=2174846 RepID=UPI00343031F7